MKRRGVGRLLRVFVLVGIVTLFAGHVLGQPILLGFVETGSMEPTIDAGDGFVAVPSAVAGEPEAGDVIVFEAREIDGGGLTTHRVVEETERGYVTRGDANPFTDQDGGEPPVQEGQIVATAWTVGETTITIPHLGTAVTTVGDGLESVQHLLANSLGRDAGDGARGLAYLVLAVSASLYAVETIRERRRPSTASRVGRGGDGRPTDPKRLCLAFALLVGVAAFGAMVVPAGSHSYDVVSAEFDSDRPLVIERGTTDDVPYPVPNAGFVPIVSYVEPGTEDVTVDPTRTAVGPRDDAEVTVSITAPDETGYYPTYVTEYRYLHVLPTPVIDALHEIHPWVPIAAVVSLLGGGTYAVGRVLLGSGDVRARRRSRNRGRAGIPERRY